MEDMRATSADGRLRFWSDGSRYSNSGEMIDLDDDYILFSSLSAESIENPVQPAHPAPVVFEHDACYDRGSTFRLFIF